MSRTSTPKSFSNSKKAKQKHFQNLHQNLKKPSKTVLNTSIRKTIWKICLKTFQKIQRTINLQLLTANTKPQRTQTPQHRILEPKLPIKTETTVFIANSMIFSNKTVWLLSKKISSIQTLSNSSQKYPTIKSMSISLNLSTKKLFTRHSTTANKCQRVREIQDQSQRAFSEKESKAVVNLKIFTKV